MAFKMKGSPYPKKKIRYDKKYNDGEGSQFVKHRGKKVYGSWDEYDPDRRNKVETKGLSDHIVKKDGKLHVDETTWDSTLSHNTSTDDYDQENKRTRKTEGTKGKQRRRRRRGGFPTR